MKPKYVLTAVGLALAVGQSAFAVDLNGTYTGATPLNTLSYEFNAGTSILTLMMTGPDANEFVTDWGFDIVGNTTGWGIDSSNGVANPGLDVPSDSSLNPMSFNISFAFQSSAGDGRFQTGDSIGIYLPNVTSILGSGAHVQGIAASPGSGKVYSVPEPSSLAAVFATLGVGLGLLRRRMA